MTPEGRGWKSELLEAVEYRGLEVVKHLVEQIGDVNAKDEWGETVLMMAARLGRLEIVRYLFNQGADIHERNMRNGVNALMNASIVGHLEVVQFLVDKGANVNEKDGFGETPLRKAAAYGRIKVVEFLVSKGADVNAKDNNGNTALMMAISRGQPEVEEFLRQAGHDIEKEKRLVPITLERDKEAEQILKNELEALKDILIDDHARFFEKRKEEYPLILANIETLSEYIRDIESGKLDIVGCLFCEMPPPKIKTMLGELKQTGNIMPVLSVVNHYVFDFKTTYFMNRDKWRPRYKGEYL